jgi:hypothetical protein
LELKAIDIPSGLKTGLMSCAGCEVMAFAVPPIVSTV